MTTTRRASVTEIRAFYAKMMAAASGLADERFERIFELVPREAFLAPGPWRIMAQNRRYLETPSSDPAYLYQNVVVALDATEGINNGEPFLHAAWIGAIAPMPGETIVQIGAGTGYYTALLSMLVLPKGHVHAFELNPDLARRARQNLEPFECVTVIDGDATKLPLPEADCIYVNAGVLAPPAKWLEALRPGGRMILPWDANETTGLALVVRRTRFAFSVCPLMPAWFIPCVGASDINLRIKAPNSVDAWSIRSVWLTRNRSPDETALAIYKDVWFSSAADSEEIELPDISY